MKKLFLTDIDNTLIYSYKHAKVDDVCVEMIHDKPQGYMPPFAYNHLRELEKAYTIVPVTTRSKEQFSRLNLPLSVEYAVVANGGVLLKNAKEDDEWKRIVGGEIKDALPCLEELEKQLIEEDNYIRVRMVDGIYLFAYCKEGVNPKLVEEKYSSLYPSVSVVASGKKVYFLPDKINKGEATKKIIDLFSPSLVISAGDSEMDAPMLNLADIALVPSGYPMQLLRDGLKVIVCDQKPFPDCVVKTLLELEC